ncbi:hypothetical protein, partial [Atlantibacter hermannii]|uniref:hypothetical protein n=1 Tax=Atlantibacter hermannii TaxID=565 RepID=UPI001C8D1412
LTRNLIYSTKPLCVSIFAGGVAEGACSACAVLNNNKPAKRLQRKGRNLLILAMSVPSKVSRVCAVIFIH